MIAMLGDSQEMTFTFYYGGQQPKKLNRSENPTPPMPSLSGDVYDLSALDQLPQVRGIQAAPEYPAEMKRQGITGKVIIQFIVDANGQVRDITVVKSTNKTFNKPAIEAVQKWRFIPGKKGGKSVNTRMQIPIEFNLGGDGS